MQKGNTFKKFNKRKYSASFFGEQKRNKYIFFYSILPSSVLYIKYYASTKNLATPNKNRKLPITFFARKTFAKNRRQRSHNYCAKKYSPKKLYMWQEMQKTDDIPIAYWWLMRRVANMKNKHFYYKTYGHYSYRTCYMRTHSEDVQKTVREGA